VEGRSDIDRILDGPAVGRPGVVIAGIGVTRDGTGLLGDQIGKTARQQRLLAACHFGRIRRLDLERCRAVRDGVGVNAGDGRDIARPGRPDVSVAHRASRSTKKKAPRTWPGALTFVRARSAPVAHQTQKHQKQVDEVEIEPQGAHDRLTAGNGAVVVYVVHLLDLLCVPGGEASKD